MVYATGTQTTNRFCSQTAEGGAHTGTASFVSPVHWKSKTDVPAIEREQLVWIYNKDNDLLIKIHEIFVQQASTDLDNA